MAANPELVVPSLSDVQLLGADADGGEKDDGKADPFAKGTIAECED